MPQRNIDRIGGEHAMQQRAELLRLRPDERRQRRQVALGRVLDPAFEQRHGARFEIAERRGIVGDVCDLDRLHVPREHGLDRALPAVDDNQVLAETCRSAKLLGLDPRICLASAAPERGLLHGFQRR